MICWILFLALSGFVWAEEPSAEKIEFFEKRIRPILAQDCYECHRTGGKKKGGLALDHRAAMAEGGDSDDLFDFENPRIKDGRNESALKPAQLKMVYHGFATTDDLDEKVRLTDVHGHVVHDILA